MAGPEIIDEKWITRIREHMGTALGDPYGVSRRAADLATVARRISAQIGELPPQPPTFRARGGRILVGLVRRALFWHTPQIRRALDALTDALEAQVHALEMVSRNNAQSDARIAALELELAAMRDHLRHAHRDSDC